MNAKAVKTEPGPAPGVSLKDIDVFLVMVQDKDRYCLEPLTDALSKVFRSVSLAGTETLGPEIDDLARATCPVVISSSLFALEFVRFLRAGQPFLSIGVEHGIAPFKGYSFSEKLLEHDMYIAPTALWADRLKVRNPGRASRLALGGYPRLDTLAGLRAAQAKAGDTGPYWPGVPDGERKLVILSWGLRPLEVSKLPDREDVVYLVHPAETRKAPKITFKRSKVVVSDPESAAALLAHADQAFGDFSSMTLEACALGVPTAMFLIRDLYIPKYDLPDAFFDRADPAFAGIPHTKHQFKPADILDADGLNAALNRTGKAKGGKAHTINAQLPAGILPPEGSSADTIADIVRSVVLRDYAERVRTTPAINRAGILRFVTSLYHEILGREPEQAGLMHHARALAAYDKPDPMRAAQMMVTFASSPEGQKRWASGEHDWPEVVIPPRKT